MARGFSLEGLMAELLLKMSDGQGGSASWRGQTFEANADGEIAVPFEAADDLMSHGFMPCGQIGEVEAPEAAPEAESEADEPAAAEAPKGKGK
jgi:hypothetical protein